MEKSNFDELLERYLRNEISEEERKKLESWLDSRKTTPERNIVWSKDDEERLFRRITQKTFDTELTEIPAAPPVASKFATRPWMAIAAGLALIAILSYGIWSAIGAARDAVQYSTTGQSERVVLADGSIVWLKPNSTLTWIKTDGSQRRADLDGEGLFEIAKDAAHPFFIDCGKVTVRVVGTSFTLSKKKETVELNVLTGKVHVSSPSSRDGVDVLPLERVVYSGAHIGTTSFTKEKVMALTAGTEYDMDFQNSPMDEVLGKMEKKFKVVVRTEKPELRKCRITADFTDMSLEHTLQMLSELLEMTYAINGATVSITGTGCHATH